MKQVRSRQRFVLQDFLPFLANRAGVKTGLVFARDLQQFSITLAEWRILIALWDSEKLRLNDVADILVADLSTTSRQTRSLEQAGLIARAKSSSDRRALELVLTEKGRQLTERIISVAMVHERAATQGLTANELAMLRYALVKIFDNLSAFERETCGPTSDRRR